MAVKICLRAREPFAVLKRGKSGSQAIGASPLLYNISIPMVTVFSLTFFSWSNGENQGWRQEFSKGGLTLPMRGLKYGFQGTISAQNLRKNRFHLPTGASMLRRGAIAPSPPLAPPLVKTPTEATEGV